MARQVIASDTLYSRAVWAGETLYLSGILGLGDSVADRVKDAFDKADALLAQAGLTRAHVVKVNLFLDDMGDYDALNAVYPTYFESPLPARTCLAVAAIPRGAHLEIEFIASRAVA